MATEEAVPVIEPVDRRQTPITKQSPIQDPVVTDAHVEFIAPVSEPVCGNALIEE